MMDLLCRKKYSPKGVLHDQAMLEYMPAESVGMARAIDANVTVVHCPPTLPIRVPFPFLATGMASCGHFGNWFPAINARVFLSPAPPYLFFSSGRIVFSVVFEFFRPVHLLPSGLA
jgi:hypothetical protein